MACLLGRIAEAVGDFWWEAEGSIMIYLMACGAVANLAAAGYGVYWLFNHVGIV